MALHYVLVQDTCFGSWVWSYLHADLAQAHSVKLVTLPVPSYTDVCDIHGYTQPLLDVLAELPAGDKAVLVAHGMGGINAAIAMENYKDKIAVAIFVNAFMPDTSHAPSFVIDSYMSNSSISWDDTETWSQTCTGGGPNLVTMKFGNAYLQKQMYNKSPKQDLQDARDWTTVGSFFQASLATSARFTEDNYGSVARAYIQSALDQAMPNSFQKWQLDNYPLQDTNDHHQVTNADHMIMISEHSALSKLVLDIAKKYAL